jgi:hypothetical protein
VSFYKPVIWTRVLIGLPLLLAAYLIFSFFFSRHYKALMASKMPGWVLVATDSLYHVYFDDLRINLINQHVTITGVTLWPDEDRLAVLRSQGRAPDELYRFHIPRLQLRGISWGKLRRDSSISLRRLLVWQPVVHIIADAQPSDILPEIASKPALKRISAARIEILDPELLYEHRSGARPFSCFLKNGSIKLDHWELRPGHKDTSGFFYARGGSLQLDTISYTVTGSLYRGSAAGLHFATNTRKLTFENLRITPTMSIDSFYRKVGHQQDIYTFSVAELGVYRLNWQQLLAGRMLAADSISMDKAGFEVYFSRMPPVNTESRLGNFPNQMLQRAGLPINIGRLRLSNGQLRYTELSQQTQRTASLSFSQLNGTVEHISNMPELTKEPYAIALASARLEHQTEVQARFVFSLTDTLGGFRLTARMRNLHADQISDQAKALALAEIRSLHVTELGFDIKGNERMARGRYDMRYEDLRLNLQKLDTNTLRMNDRLLLSFIANQLVIYPQNPMPGQPPRIVSNTIIRNPSRSFFSLIWQGLYEGVGKIAVRDPEMIELIKRSKERKEQRRLRRAKRQQTAFTELATRK